MSTLFIQLSIWLVAATCLSALFGFGYLLYQRAQQLKEFRANIRVGQMVRILRPDGSTVRARIIIKNSDFHFVAIDIDTKVHHFTAASCIYKP